MENRIRSWGVKSARTFRTFVSVLMALALTISLAPSLAWAQDARESDKNVSAIAGEASAITADSSAAADASVGGEVAAKAAGTASTAKTAVDSVSSAQDDARSVDKTADDATITPPSTTEGTNVQTETVEVSVSVIGPDANGANAYWAQGVFESVSATGTAWDASAAAFATAKLTYDAPDSAYGKYLSTITDPHDSTRTLGYDASTGRYWQLFVNGTAASSGASGITLKAGDSVVWYYSAYGASLPDASSIGKVAASVSVIGMDANGAYQSWAPSADYTFTSGATVADATAAMLSATSLVNESGIGTYGYYLSTITDPRDSTRTLGYDASTGRYWQLFVNGTAASVGASGITLKAGDSVVWCYSAYGSALPDAGSIGKVAATISVIGPDANGADSYWVQSATGVVTSGASAWDASAAAFATAKLTYDAPDSAYGKYLSTITDPRDSTRTLGYDAATGRYWQLFVNGTAASVGASGITLKAGDSVVWYYSAYQSSIPTVIADPDVKRPAYSADWPGYMAGSPTGSNTQAATPASGATLSWSASFLGTQSWVLLSDPIIVNGDLYIASGTAIYKVDAATGRKALSGTLAASMGYGSRIVYADGLIIVPLEGGRVQALTADTLTTVWLTPSLGSDQQSLSRLTVSGDRLYLGTTTSRATDGYLMCIDVKTGSVIWKTQNTQAGYYWSGAAPVNGFLVIADNAGVVSSINPETGAVVGTLTLGSGSFSSIVTDGASTAYAVTRDDGTLHRIAVGADGSLSATGTVKFASRCVSSPTYANGRIFIGGANADYTGILAVVDAGSMTVLATIANLSDGGALPGSVSSAPLVSTQPTGTYVYFTSNAQPGGVYLYRLGDGTASALYLPEGTLSNWCDASVVCDSSGTLYYRNDSGTLFKLMAKASAAGGGASTPGQAAIGSESDGGGTSGQVAAASTIDPSQTPLGASAAATTVSAAAGSSAQPSGNDAESGIAENETPTAAPAAHPILPWVGIGIGVAGLIAVGLWLALGRRREQRDSAE